MIASPDSLFAFPEPTALLRGELAHVGALAAARPGGRALLVQACAAHRELPVDMRHLRLLRLHAQAGVLRGDVDCAPDALPFQSEAFQFVVVQHAADALPLPIDEISRVLAPGGSLLWFGFNPWSPWVAWMHWQARRGLPLPGATSADAVRRRFAACGLDSEAPHLFGSYWPSRGEADGTLAPLRAAWRLVACKRVSVLTPLRPRRPRIRVSARPSLAAPSRRLCG